MINITTCLTTLPDNGGSTNGPTCVFSPKAKVLAYQINIYQPYIDKRVYRECRASFHLFMSRLILFLFGIPTTYYCTATSFLLLQARHLQQTW